MSDFFDVTTDYLLKGIEPVEVEAKQQEEKPNAMIFTIVATAFNVLGLIIAVMVWLVNTWLLSFIPLSLIYNAVIGAFFVPLSILAGNKIMRFVMLVLIYFVLNTAVTLVARKMKWEQL